MGLKPILYASCLALATGASAEGLHLASKGLLQIPPSFAGDGISLYPGHHPDHNADDLFHLVPQTSHELYYSQEGHRPALHGAKHGRMNATFVRPTVVLDHSSQLRQIQCSDGHVSACFQPGAFDTVQKSWNVSDFNLVTYHVGCGDEYAGKRTFFRATDPQFDPQGSCARVAVTAIEEEGALHSGEISWGTYTDPRYRKRVPVKGHVRIERSIGRVVRRQDDGGDDDPEDTGDEGDDIEYSDPGEPVDLTNNATALTNYFDDPDLDTTDMDQPVEGDEDLDFISGNGDAWLPGKRSPARQADFWSGVGEFFKGIFNGIKDFFKSIGDFLTSVPEAVVTVADMLLTAAIVAAKLLAVPFGVPFKHAYHHDFKFSHYLTAEASNRPPAILGATPGFTLAGDGEAYTAQCVKCGFEGDFVVDGRLAFSIQDGVTEGKVELVNKNPFTIDAQFGFTVEKSQGKSVEEVSKQLAAFPLSPLTIPGIVSLGPQVSISVALDLSLSGTAELLVGASFSISPGTAALSIVNQEDNKLEGLEATLTPVFKASGEITATAELGLPVALEVGIDILSGKWKKTVGLVNKPSIYASAIYSAGEGHKCNEGIELRVGIKNRIYVAALELWDYDIRTDVLYEKGLGCITADGFDADQVEDATDVFDSIVSDLSRDSLDKAPGISDVASQLSSTTNNAGFRIIMDEEKSSILVSGEDGFLYMVQTAENYDLSAPWGTININEPSVNLDVFGRILSGRHDSHQLEYVTELRVFEPDKVPSNERAAALAILKTSDQNYEKYGVLLKHRGNMAVFYPTVCKTSKGVRLFATKWAVNKDGKVEAKNTFRRRAQEKGLKEFGASLSDCRSIQLTSKVDR